MDSLRLFLAFPVPGRIAKNLVTSFRALNIDPSILKPVSDLNIHVTLKFLGNTHVDTVPEIIRISQTTFSQFQSPEVDLMNGAPLPRQKPKAIVVTIKKNSELQELYGAIDLQLAEHGLHQPERRVYKPHVTVARIRHGSFLSDEDIKKVEEWKFANSWIVPNIDLIEAKLSPAGPVYDVLQSFHLR